MAVSTSTASVVLDTGSQVQAALEAITAIVTTALESTDNSLLGNRLYATIAVITAVLRGTIGGTVCVTINDTDSTTTIDINTNFDGANPDYERLVAFLLESYGDDLRWIASFNTDTYQYKVRYIRDVVKRNCQATSWKRHLLFNHVT